MKTIKVLYIIAILGILGSMACKKKDNITPEPELILGPGEHLLRSIYINKTMTDSFAYNSKQQIITYVTPHYRFHIAYDEHDLPKSVETYQKKDNNWNLMLKSQISFSNQEITSYGAGIDSITNGSKLFMTDTIHMLLDNKGRVIQSIDSELIIIGTLRLRFIDTYKKTYVNDQLATVELKSLAYEKNQYPTAGEKSFVLEDSRYDCDYENVPGTLAAIRQSNPYLEDILLPFLHPLSISFLRGKIQSKLKHFSNASDVVGSNYTSEATFTDTYYPNTPYVKSRKTTLLSGTLTRDQTSTFTSQFYYTPLP